MKYIKMGSHQKSFFLQKRCSFSGLQVVRNPMNTKIAGCRILCRVYRLIKVLTFQPNIKDKSPRMTSLMKSDIQTPFAVISLHANYGLNRVNFSKIRYNPHFNQPEYGAENSTSGNNRISKYLYLGSEPANFLTKP